MNANISRSRLTALILALFLLPAALGAVGQSAYLARQFQDALNRIQRNAGNPGHHPPVVLTAAGANAYLFQDAKLPPAIQDLRLSSTPGVIQGQADIDFSRLPHRGASGWAQLIFNGDHHVSAVARLDRGSAPNAQLTVESVSLDGTQIPNVLVDLAIREFVTPKYPQIQGRTFAWPLPAHVRSLSVEANRAVLRY